MRTKTIKVWGLTKDGTLLLNQEARDAIKAHFAGEDQYVHITLSTATGDVSDEQRGYYFGVIVKSIAQGMREAGSYNIDPNDSKDLYEVHRYLTERFGSETTGMYDKDGNLLEGSKSIKRHDKREQEEYHEKCRQFAKEYFNTEIPLPNE